MVAARLRRNRKITITTSATVSISSNCTSSTEARMVVVRSVRMSTVTDGGSDVWSCGSSFLTRSTTSMMFAPGCRWMLTMTGRASSFIHAGQLARSRRRRSTSATSDSCTGAPFAVALDDQRLVLVAGEELVVGADRVGLARPVEAPLGLVDVGRGDGGAQVVQVQPAATASAVGFAWMRTAGFCPPLMLTSPTPGSCEIFCASRVSARSSTFDSGSVLDWSAPA